MLYFNSLRVVLIIVSISLSKCQRRIVHGNRITTNKPYMVYLIKAEQSPHAYDSWICGGAIVTPLFILTSAACVEDVQFMYAIAGYDKYLNQTNNTYLQDDCINKGKKKIVFTCTPKQYDFDYKDYDKWSKIDIALVKVESPYNFRTNEKPSQVCTWAPHYIEISYDWKHIIPGTDAMVLGWGHAEKWRKERDTKDRNSEFLQYSPVLIINKTECKGLYDKLPQMHDIIDKYMVCTMGKGNIDDAGRQIDRPVPKGQGCQTIPIRTNDTVGRSEIVCFDEDGVPINNAEEFALVLRRSFDANSSSIILPDNVTIGQLFDKYRHANANKEATDDTPEKASDEFVLKGPTRRHGICQNDHGGPLVTWVGSKEVVIGVASVFLVKENFDCVGPYLFTSTKCNGAFLGCVLGSQETDDDEKYRRLYGPPVGFNDRVCRMLPEERGFTIVKRRISWIDHPDGPADNEIMREDLFERPQVPLSNFNKGR